jgi:hypothetical protein
MELKSAFQAIRQSVESRTLPDSIHQSLLKEFALASRRRVQRRFAGWAMAAVAAAAMIWIAVERPAAPGAGYSWDALSEGFQAVPYAPVLASGEFVRVVRTELAPDTLTRMGVFVASANLNPISVDLVVGQDDAPLAVRVNEEDEQETQ